MDACLSCEEIFMFFFLHVPITVIKIIFVSSVKKILNRYFC